MFTYLCLSCEFLREKLHAFKEKKKIFSCAAVYRVLVPQSGIDPQQRKHRVLTTRPQGIPRNIIISAFTNFVSLIREISV